jgi:transcriptional regulator with XRE-family HTH domain
MMASSQTLGEVLGRRLAHYRDRAGLTQPGLSARLAELGFDISRVTIANIEAAGRSDSSAKNRTRADNATVVDLLAFALALNVPPVLLIVPLGVAGEMWIGNVKMHPELAMLWFAGDAEPSRIEEDEGVSKSFGFSQWSENAEVLKMYRRLQDVMERASAAATYKSRVEDETTEEHRSYMRESGLDRWNVTYTAADVATAQETFDQCLVELDAVQRQLLQAGRLFTEVIPDSWADRIHLLRSVRGGRP